MKIRLEILIILIISWNSFAKAQTISTEALGPIARMVMAAWTTVFGPSLNDTNGMRLAKERNLLQPRIADNVPFPCQVIRSGRRPTSVHSLRPQDINVIGAIGDSLTAGHGLVAINVLQTPGQTRGLSPFAGGQSTWREYVTLPNILKEFNPRLIGYSLGDAFLNQNDSQFNVAEAAALSKDLPFMAKALVTRMKNDPRVNIRTDWKIITIWIGGFNFCTDVCYHKDPESLAEPHRVYLTKALRILKRYLPRTLVNLILVPNIQLLKKSTVSNRPPLCFLTLSIFCSCMFGAQFQSSQPVFDQLFLHWRQVEIEVTSDPEFDTDDFTVVLQPFTINYSIPVTQEGLTDYSNLSPDCFHLSQKEAAKVANSLWNNMLQPVGRKSENPTNLFNFNCPSYEYPYIFTRRNSV